jgi:hypothetical protein
MFIFAEIDGQPYHFGHALNEKKRQFSSKEEELQYNENEMYGALCYMSFRPKILSADQYGSEVDFWCWNQSINFKVWHDQFLKYDDTWDYSTLKLRYVMQGLAPGKHKVRFELKYRLRNIADDAYSPICSAGAAGEFIMDTSQGIPRSLQIYPQRRTKLSPTEADELESQARKYLRLDGEYILHVALAGDWEHNLKEEIKAVDFYQAQKITYEEHYVPFAIVTYNFNAARDFSNNGPYIGMRTGYLAVENTNPGGKYSLPFVEDKLSVCESFPAAYLPRDIVIPKNVDASCGSDFQKYA